MRINEEWRKTEKDIGEKETKIDEWEQGAKNRWGEVKDEDTVNETGEDANEERRRNKERKEGEKIKWKVQACKTKGARTSGWSQSRDVKNQTWITGNSRKVAKGRTNELLDTRDGIKCCLARISREKPRRFVPPHFGWKFTASGFSLLPLIVHFPLWTTFLPSSFHNCGAISRLVASFIVDSIPPSNLPHPASLHLHNLRSFSPSRSLSAPSARTHKHLNHRSHAACTPIDTAITHTRRWQHTVLPRWE